MKNIIKKIVLLFLFFPSVLFAQLGADEQVIYGQGYPSNFSQQEMVEKLSEGACFPVSWAENGNVIVDRSELSEEKLELLMKFGSDMTDFTYTVYKTTFDDFSVEETRLKSGEQVASVFYDPFTITGLQMNGLVIPMPKRLPKDYCVDGECAVPSAHKYKLLPTSCGTLLLVRWAPKCSDIDYKIEKDLKIRTNIDDFGKKVFKIVSDELKHQAWYVGKIYPATIPAVVIGQHILLERLQDYYTSIADLLEFASHLPDLLPFGSVLRSAIEAAETYTGVLDKDTLTRRIQEAGGGWRFAGGVSFDLVVDGLPLLSQVNKLKNYSKALWLTSFAATTGVAIYDARYGEKDQTLNNIGRIIVLGLTGPSVFKKFNLPDADLLAKDIEPVVELAKDQGKFLTVADDVAEKVAKSPELDAVVEVSRKELAPFTVKEGADLGKAQYLHKLIEKGIEGAEIFFEEGQFLIKRVANFSLESIIKGTSSAGSNASLYNMLELMKTNPITTNKYSVVLGYHDILSMLRRETAETHELALKIQNATLENMKKFGEEIQTIFKTHGNDVPEDVLVEFVERTRFKGTEPMDALLAQAPDNIRHGIYQSAPGLNRGIIGKGDFPWRAHLEKQFAHADVNKKKIVDNIINRLEGYDNLISWEEGVHRFQDALDSGAGMVVRASSGAKEEVISSAADSINFRAWLEKQSPDKVADLVKKEMENYLNSPTARNLGVDYVEQRFKRLVDTLNPQEMMDKLSKSKSSVCETDVFFKLNEMTDYQRIKDYWLLSHPGDRILPRIWLNLGKPQ